jgi:hypothetical protein
MIGRSLIISLVALTGCAAYCPEPNFGQIIGQDNSYSFWRDVRCGAFKWVNPYKDPSSKEYRCFNYGDCHDGV